MKETEKLWRQVAGILFRLKSKGFPYQGSIDWTRGVLRKEWTGEPQDHVDPRFRQSIGGFIIRNL